MSTVTAYPQNYLLPVSHQEHMPGLQHNILFAGSKKQAAQKLMQSLQYVYRVIAAEDLNDACKVATERSPEVIVADFSSSRADVLQLCWQLKQSPATKHIPVILVADQLDSQSRLTALQFGAVDCLAGPDCSEELIWRIRNLIHLCNTIQKGSSAPGPVSVHSQAPMPSGRCRLVAKIMEVLEKNYSNPFFCVRIFSREVGLSQIQLYRKIIALTGHSPNDYIRLFRLQRAAEMFQAEAGNIGEVAYQVGFSNLSYFSKCFRKMHGYTPSEFIRRVRTSTTEDPEVTGPGMTVIH
jgi:AraC-like DNA-binding protein